MHQLNYKSIICVYHTRVCPLIILLLLGILFPSLEAEAKERYYDVRALVNVLHDLVLDSMVRALKND